MFGRLYPRRRSYCTRLLYAPNSSLLWKIFLAQIYACALPFLPLAFSVVRVREHEITTFEQTHSFKVAIFDVAPKKRVIWPTGLFSDFHVSWRSYGNQSAIEIAAIAEHVFERSQRSYGNQALQHWLLKSRNHSATPTVIWLFLRCGSKPRTTSRHIAMFSCQVVWFGPVDSFSFGELIFHLEKNRGSSGRLREGQKAEPH